MKVLRAIFLIMLFFLTPLFQVRVIAQNNIPFSVISSGGGQQTNSAYIINGSLGQTIIGNCENATNLIQTGFWQIYYQSVLVNVDDDRNLPNEFKLEQNFPNPFNPSTIIKFGVAGRCNVQIKIFDVLGSEIRTLVNEEMDAGWYELIFNASSYASGIYIYRMQAGNYISIKKMLMIK